MDLQQAKSDEEREKIQSIRLAELESMDNLAVSNYNETLKTQAINIKRDLLKVFPGLMEPNNDEIDELYRNPETLVDIKAIHNHLQSLSLSAKTIIDLGS